ncbi:MAG TPA: folylpolyglutamate synthase/dihydrofolate synthase family protein [Alphaproteobacteria bacterium]|nr:bifunctional folylpolyglutamate synthase/dihydrofolate synthase [Alphaproteobacteria bacterium]HOO50467.1 folylpolyglutamate synthase/dihydrofolate synthase family protein [Alphaproteobacteria bacterium]
MLPAPNSSLDRVLPDHFDPDPRLQALLERLTGYYPRGIDPGLGRTIRLLDDLGNPHLSLPPVIHVAGTNGKGSIIAYLRAILEKAGLTCHVMTSPHLVRFNERFIVSGQEMATEGIIPLFDEVEAINNGQETTSFELITAAGFLEFSRKPADVVLLEVGMGGRFDATNVIPHPLLSIISVISRDHTKFLGSSFRDIAFEKGGIIKSGVPCVISPQLHSECFEVFEGIAEDISAPMFSYGQDWSFDVLQQSFLLHGQENLFELPLPNLVGAHQISNAAVAAYSALHVAERFRSPITLSDIEFGLTHARWPARLQKIVRGPLIDLLPEGSELWIDGGHNDSCGQALSRQAQVWKDDDRKDLHLVLGMLNTKDPMEFFEPLSSYASHVSCITIPDQPLSFSADALADVLQKGCRDCSSAIDVASSLREAVQMSLGLTQKPVRILITGSLYLMGAVLQDHS